MLTKKFNEMADLYYQVKKEIRSRDRNLYEKWQAGGFLVDDAVASQYPTLSQVVQSLGDEQIIDEEWKDDEI